MARKHGKEDKYERAISIYEGVLYSKDTDVRFLELEENRLKLEERQLELEDSRLKEEQEREERKESFNRIYLLCVVVVYLSTIPISAHSTTITKSIIIKHTLLK